MQEFFQRFRSARPRVAAQKFRRGGRRTCARVEQNDIHFAAGERLIDHRQIAQNEREEAESDPALEYDHETLRPGVRHHVAEAEREQRRAAQVEAGLERGMRRVPRGVAVVHQPETENNRGGPDDEQNQDRKRAVEAEKRLTGFRVLEAVGQRSPRNPRAAIDEDRHAKAAPHPARENDGLERLPQDDRNDQHARRQPEESCSLLQGRRHCDFRLQQSGHRAIGFRACGG